MLSTTSSVTDRFRAGARVLSVARLPDVPLLLLLLLPMSAAFA